MEEKKIIRYDKLLPFDYFCCLLVSAVVQINSSSIHHWYLWIYTFQIAVLHVFLMWIWLTFFSSLNFRFEINFHQKRGEYLAYYARYAVVVGLSGLPYIKYSSLHGRNQEGLDHSKKFWAVLSLRFKFFRGEGVPDPPG